MKKLLLVLTLALCAPMTFAQTVPSNVPTDGLVGYWPFNGNANDQSGNGNNGTVNGATLTTDRFGNTNSAYSFNGINNSINMPSGSITSINITSNFTLTFWFKTTQDAAGLIGFGDNYNGNNGGYLAAIGNSGMQNVANHMTVFTGNTWYSGHINLTDNNWHYACVVLNGSNLKIIIDNILDIEFNSATAPTSFNGLRAIGARNNGLTAWYNGKVDDIGIWNRALTQAEISALYQGCLLSVTTQPTNQTTNISNNAQFTVVSSDPDATYQWQKDLGVGFQNISNAGQYTGATTSALTIANTTLSNNNQLFRCVIAKASCTETSSVATLNVNEAITSNVPTEGLVGYWPFNGNANDESGNNNNGTVNGATLTTDRFGNSNGAYSFDGINSYIIANNTPNILTSNYSVSIWFNSPTSLCNNNVMLRSGDASNCGWQGFYIATNTNRTNFGLSDYGNNNYAFVSNYNCNNVSLNEWHNLVYTRENLYSKEYIDGILVNSNSSSYYDVASNCPLFFGSNHLDENGNSWDVFNGKLDDIAIYNRALTQEEITQLYYTDNTCQSLVINTGVLSFNPPTYNNTVTIYPNPANDHITIDCGNLANVSGWSIKIFNTLGQEVFSGAMNTQQYVVPLNTWSGQGVYFVKIYDASNQLMNTKKIILQ